MALKGTLADMGIVELVQFPNARRRTGELVITVDGLEGRLYYDQGSLVHASLGDVEGMEALVRMVDWTEGSFEFLNDSEPSRRTLEMDLHRAVMQALKLHDERKEESERLKNEAPTGPPGDEAGLCSQLQEFVSSTDFAQYACVVSADGKLRGSAMVPDHPAEGVEELRGSLHSLCESYPRPRLNRVFLADEQGTVVLLRLSDGSGLIVIARKEASLGAVSMGVGRLAGSLE